MSRQLSYYIIMSASGRMRDPDTMELRLVQSKRAIETPPTLQVAMETTKSYMQNS